MMQRLKELFLILAILRYFKRFPKITYMPTKWRAKNNRPYWYARCTISKRTYALCPTVQEARFELLKLLVIIGRNMGKR